MLRVPFWLSWVKEEEIKERKRAVVLQLVRDRLGIEWILAGQRIRRKKDVCNWGGWCPQVAQGKSNSVVVACRRRCLLDPSLEEEELLPAGEGQWRRLVLQLWPLQDDQPGSAQGQQGLGLLWWLHLLRQGGHRTEDDCGLCLVARAGAYHLTTGPKLSLHRMGRWRCQSCLDCCGSGRVCCHVPEPHAGQERNAGCCSVQHQPERAVEGAVVVAVRLVRWVLEDRQLASQQLLLIAVAAAVAVAIVVEEDRLAVGGKSLTMLQLLLMIRSRSVVILCWSRPHHGGYHHNRRWQSRRMEIEYVDVPDVHLNLLAWYGHLASRWRGSGRWWLAFHAA